MMTTKREKSQERKIQTQKWRISISHSKSLFKRFKKRKKEKNVKQINYCDATDQIWFECLKTLQKLAEKSNIGSSKLKVGLDSIRINVTWTVQCAPSVSVLLDNLVIYSYVKADEFFVHKRRREWERVAFERIPQMTFIPEYALYLSIDSYRKSEIEFFFSLPQSTKKERNTPSGSTQREMRWNRVINRNATVPIVHDDFHFQFAPFNLVMSHSNSPIVAVDLRFDKAYCLRWFISLWLSSINALSSASLTNSVHFRFFCHFPQLLISNWLITRLIRK